MKLQERTENNLSIANEGLPWLVHPICSIDKIIFLLHHHDHFGHKKAQYAYQSLYINHTWPITSSCLMVLQVLMEI